MQIPSNTPPALRLPVPDVSGQDQPKLASKQVDDVDAVKPDIATGHRRISYTWDEDLEQNVTHVVDNQTGDVTRKGLTDAQRDHVLRIRKLVGQSFDEKA